MVNVAGKLTILFVAVGSQGIGTLFFFFCQNCAVFNYLEIVMFGVLRVETEL
jgi:hypothetical protein